MQKIPFNDPYYERLRVFLDASNSETDRGRALVSASLLEEMLEEILCGFMLDIKEQRTLFDAPNAPLSTLSAKSLLTRSLGLITALEFKDIDTVRKIRNNFAHSVLCSFDDDKIIGLSNNLRVGMTILDALPKGDKSRVDDPRGRFSMVTTSLITSLYNRAHYAKKLRLNETDFPE